MQGFKWLEKPEETRESRQSGKQPYNKTERLLHIAHTSLATIAKIEPRFTGHSLSFVPRPSYTASTLYYTIQSQSFASKQTHVNHTLSKQFAASFANASPPYTHLSLTFPHVCTAVLLLSPYIPPQLSEPPQHPLMNPTVHKPTV
jgi:hypothetical protein